MRLREKTQLNDRVAIKVMGWIKRDDGFWSLPNSTNLHGTGFTHDKNDNDFSRFNPAENIVDAWMVLKVIQKNRFPLSIVDIGCLQRIYTLSDRDAAACISKISLKMIKRI